MAQMRPDQPQHPAGMAEVSGNAVSRTPVALTIAGSDSGGGAGIQADLKAFARCGVHGTCAITAITAQNTVGVQAIHQVPPEIVLAQVRAVLSDIGVDAVKVGMLGTLHLVHAVAHVLDELPAGTPVVIDPVMVAESGARLLDPDAQSALIAEILPRASVLTPNLPEARVLVGRVSVGEEGAWSVEGAERAQSMEGAKSAQIAKHGGAAAEKKKEAAAEEAEAEEGDQQAQELARALLALGPRAVVLTGGHRARAVDLFVSYETGGEVVEIAGERHPGGAAHGSGCTHSSVLAAQLACGRSPLQAARIARRLAGEAVANGLRDLGAGAGPVDVIGLARMRTR